MIIISTCSYIKIPMEELFVKRNWFDKQMKKTNMLIVSNLKDLYKIVSEISVFVKNLFFSTAISMNSQCIFI